MRPSPPNASPSTIVMLPPSSVSPVVFVSQSARRGRPLPFGLFHSDTRSAVISALDDRDEGRLVLEEGHRFFDAVLEEVAEVLTGRGCLRSSQNFVRLESVNARRRWRRRRGRKPTNHPAHSTATPAAAGHAVARDVDCFAETAHRENNVGVDVGPGHLEARQVPRGKPAVSARRVGSPSGARRTNLPFWSLTVRAISPPGPMSRTVAPGITEPL